MVKYAYKVQFKANGKVRFAGDKRRKGGDLHTKRGAEERVVFLKTEYNKTMKYMGKPIARDIKIVKVKLR